MIYIDSDGVIADFYTAANAIGAAGIKHGCTDAWKRIEQQDNFFLHLEELPDAVDSVIEIVRKYGLHQVEILTALPRLTGKLTSSQRDKVQWFRQRLSVLQVNAVPNWEHKIYFAKDKRDILIDDTERNTSAWTSAGGTAILHRNWKDTLNELDKIMTSFKGELK